MVKCEKCKAEVSEKANFCPNCGEPLTELAKNMKKEDKRTAMLEVVVALSGKIKDPDSLSVLNAMLQKLKP